MTPEKKLNLSSPATYRIRIQGYLDNTWANELGGLTFTNHVASRRPMVTALTGRVIDQAELLGVLNRLYGLGFPLLSLECLEIGEQIIEQ
jgi:hypothetical protein